MHHRAVQAPDAGAVYTKTYKRKTYTLEAVERHGIVRYALGDKEYSSPTAAAMAITGYNTNGPAFWGIQKSV